MKRVASDDSIDAADSEDGGEQDGDIVVDVDDILPDIITAEQPVVTAAADAESDDDINDNDAANESNEPEENVFYKNPDQLALMYLHSKGLREWPTDANQIEWIKKCIDSDIPDVIDISGSAPIRFTGVKTNNIIDLSVDLSDVPNIPKSMIAPSSAGGRSAVPLQQQIERQNSTNYAIW